MDSLDTLEYRTAGLYFPRSHFMLHALISSAGHTRLKKHDYGFYGLERGKEDFIVFQYTLKGRGELRYKGENYALTPGTAMLVHIPHDHYYGFPDDSEDWDFVYLCLHGSEVMRIGKSVEKMTGPVLFPERGSPLLHMTEKIIRTVLSEGDAPDVLTYSSLAYQWIMLLAGFIQGAGSEEPPAIGRVRQFCRENLPCPIGVDDMARAAGCSRSHLSRLFARNTGMGLREYLENLRMQKASGLLLNHDITIKEVAGRCGYADENYFCKVFRKNFSRSPGQYRETGL